MAIIKYDLPKLTHVSLIIYDLNGKEIQTLVNEKQNQGKKHVAWMGLNDQGKPMPTGLYIYRLETPEFSKSFKMVYLK